MFYGDILFSPSPLEYDLLWKVSDKNNIFLKTSCWLKKFKSESWANEFQIIESVEKNGLKFWETNEVSLQIRILESLDYQIFLKDLKRRIIKKIQHGYLKFP